MTRAPRPEDPASAPRDRAAYYLLDEARSADLQSFNCALKALADLSCNDMDGEEFDARVDRFNLKQLFVQLSRRLDHISGGEQGLNVVWLDHEVTLGGAP